jgi:hypothetical protein
MAGGINPCLPTWTAADLERFTAALDRYIEARQEWHAFQIERRDALIEEQAEHIRYQASRIRELERLLRGQEANARWQ